MQPGVLSNPADHFLTSDDFDLRVEGFENSRRIERTLTAGDYDDVFASNVGLVRGDKRSA